MTLGPSELALYSFALLLLFLTPGPVWVALIARALSSGFNGAWPLALGVVIGDVLWPLLAIFGLSLVVDVYEDFLIILRFGAAVIFLLLGLGLILKKDGVINESSRLTRPGMWAGFAAGLFVILGNPKAILFYMSVLPGFFDLRAITSIDIAVICAISALVPFIGNLALGLMVERIRALLSSQKALRRLNLTSGILLIGVGVAIGLS